MLPRRIDLSHNKFVGSIPVDNDRNSFLEALFLNNNELTGIIPPQLARWGLKELDLSHNNLEGPLPDQLGDLATLYYLNLRENALVNGRLPSTFGSLYCIQS